jgi:PAS domain S-box-containing protein
MELDANGQPEVLSGVTIDTTAVRAHRDGPDSEAGRLRLALACGSVGVFDYDIIADRGLWSAEQCRIFGVDPNIFEPKMATVWALIHAEDRLHLQALLSSSMRTGEPYMAKFRIVRPSGEVRWCTGGAAASLDESGRVVRFSGITYDVTDRVMVEEELSSALQRNEQLLSEKDLLLREMNHRIKNKLQLVTSLLNSQSRKSDDQRLRYAITEAVVRVSSVGKLFERLQRPTTSPAVHIPTYVGDLCAELQEALRATDDPQITPVVEDDTLEPDTAHALGLLIVELVTNALKHGERGAAITLSYSVRTDGKRQFVVTNFGRLPPDFSSATTESLGMQVIGAMVSRLKGKITFRQYPLGPTVECKVTFRPPAPR